MANAFVAQPEVQFFHDSPLVTPVDMRERLQAWERGETVQSGGRAVGSIALLNEHQAVLASMDNPDTRIYGNIFMDDLAGTDGLTAAQRALCQTLHDAFVGLVSTDMQRSGIGGTPHVDVRVGRYSGDGEGWHPDGGRDALDDPIARWIAIWGTGPTDFAEGPVDRSMITDAGVLRPDIVVGPHSPLKPKNYGLGTVAGFMANTDLHAPPKAIGPRILVTATARIKKS